MKHRASRLGREFSGLMAAREDVGAIFCCRVQSTAKTGAPERARGCDRLPGKGLPLAGGSLRTGALLFVLVRSMPNRPPSIARQAQAAISLIAKNQHSSTKTAGNSTALATSTGQRTRLDRAHGGTHPAKGWPPERARRGHRSPGKGLPWAGGSLRAAAFEGESASWPCWESTGSYFIDSVFP